jgi:hypothetical protein
VIPEVEGVECAVSGRPAMASTRAANTARFVVDRLVCDRPDLSARKLVRSKLDQCKGWHLKDLYAHYGCVNAIEFSSDGKLLVSGL